MATSDLTITEANVTLGTADSGSSGSKTVRYGATLGKMQAVYSDSTDNGDWKKANCGAEATSSVGGVTLSSGVDGGNGQVITDGPVVPGATLTVGETYVLSSVDGKIMKSSDLTSGDYITTIFLAISTTEAIMTIRNTGQTAP